MGLTGLAAVATGLIIGVGTASAHHADIAASVSCDGNVSWTATAWQTTNALARTNPDVRVYYRTGSGAPDQLVAQGAFNAANGFTFSGTFTFPGGTTQIVVKAVAVGQWANGNPGGASRETKVSLPTNCTTTTPPTTSHPTTTTCPPTTTTVHATTTTAAATTTTAAATTTTAAATTTTAAATTTTAAATTTTAHATTTTAAGTTTTVKATTTTAAGTTTTSNGNEAPTTTAAATTTTVAGGGGNLPSTGAGSLAIILIGIGLCMIGASVIMGVRRPA